MAVVERKHQQLVVVALVAGAAAQDCGVGGGTLDACLSYCSSNNGRNACCGPMRSADTGCLCNYWRKYKSVPYFASCAAKIRSACGIRRSC